MTIKELRSMLGMSQNKFATYTGIPVANIQNWEQGVHKPPEYVISLLYRIMVLEGKVCPKE